MYIPPLFFTNRTLPMLSLRLDGGGGFCPYSSNVTKSDPNPSILLNICPNPAGTLRLGSGIHALMMSHNLID